MVALIPLVLGVMRAIAWRKCRGELAYVTTNHRPILMSEAIYSASIRRHTSLTFEVS